jgi:hypothetical protein
VGIVVIKTTGIGSITGRLLPSERMASDKPAGFSVVRGEEILDYF